MTMNYRVDFSWKSESICFIYAVSGLWLSKNNPRGCKQQPRGFIVRFGKGV